MSLQLTVEERLVPREACVFACRAPSHIILLLFDNHKNLQSCLHCHDVLLLVTSPQVCFELKKKKVTWQVTKICSWTWGRRVEGLEEMNCSNPPISVSYLCPAVSTSMFISFLQGSVVRVSVIHIWYLPLMHKISIVTRSYGYLWAGFVLVDRLIG